MSTDPATVVTATGEIPTVNRRADAPTIYIDAVQGAMLSPLTCKLSFVEHFVHSPETEVVGRYVLNLAMPSVQLRLIGELLVRLSENFEMPPSE